MSIWIWFGSVLLWTTTRKKHTACTQLREMIFRFDVYTSTIHRLSHTLIHSSELMSFTAANKFYLLLIKYIINHWSISSAVIDVHNSSYHMVCFTDFMLMTNWIPASNMCVAIIFIHFVPMVILSLTFLMEINQSVFVELAHSFWYTWTFLISVCDSFDCKWIACILRRCYIQFHLFSVTNCKHTHIQQIRFHGMTHSYKKDAMNCAREVSLLLFSITQFLSRYLLPSSSFSVNIFRLLCAFPSEKISTNICRNK